MPGCGDVVGIRRANEDDARGIAEVHVETWRQAYRGVIPDSYLNALTVERREQYWRDEIHVMPVDRRPWVAHTDTDIVGFVASGASRRDGAPLTEGEVYAIYVLPDCWDKGVGRALLHHAERDLLANGYDDAVLWVLAANERARDFYDRAGWRVDGTKLASIGGAQLEEVSYRKTFDKSPAL